METGESVGEGPRRRFSFSALSERMRVRLNDTQRYTVLCVLVGVLCGLAAVAFHVLIDGIFHGLVGVAERVEGWRFIALMVSAPAAGGLVVGLVALRFGGAVTGSGIPQTKVAYANKFGIMRPLDAMVRFVVGAVSVGLGNSLGREGPTVHICATIASWVGQKFGLAKKRIQAMVPVGMGAGIAAAFNTPISAMFFVFEELLGDFSSKALFGILIAVVISAATERLILGEHPAFDIHPVDFETAGWMLICVPLGLIAGLMGVGFIRLLLATRAGFKRARWLPVWLRPAFGGLGVGVVGVTVFLLTLEGEGEGHLGVYGIGYFDLSAALNGEMVLVKVLLFLLVGKIVATVLAYCSGGSGGIFAPVLFIGGMLGGLVGALAEQVLGISGAGLEGDQLIGASAVLGMGALFAAVMRTPLTSIMMIFEMTQNYTLILPLMVGNSIAWLVSRRMQQLGVYDSLLLQDKICLKRMPNFQGAQDWRSLPVSTIMTFDIVTLDADKSARDALEAVGDSRKNAYPVVEGTGDERRLVGLALRRDLERHAAEGEGRPLRELLPKRVVVVNPETSIRDVAHTLVIEDVLRAPVVSKAEPRKLLGFITLHDIARQQNAIDENIGR